MGILTRLLGGTEERGLSDAAVMRAFGGVDAASGVHVSPETAMRSTAVFACVRILSEAVASLPLLIYRRQADGGKKRAPEFYLYDLLHDAPNPLMTSFEWRATLMAHVLLWGNAYCQVQASRAGQVQALWPLAPWQMTVRRSGDDLVYEYLLADGTRQILLGDEVLHLRGLVMDGDVGLSPIAAVRRAIGLGLAAEEFGAKLFGSGANVSGVLQHPGKLSDKAYERLVAQTTDEMTGLRNAHRIKVLEEGMVWTRTAIPPEDAQFLETRRFQLAEVARVYGVPLDMLAEPGGATGNITELQGIRFVTHTLRPWLVRFEQTIEQRLLLARERAQFKAEFLVDGLLRGDVQSRYQAYATARQNGWMSANEIRALENFNPVEGGDVYLVPLNMEPADAVAAQQGQPAQAAPGAPTPTAGSGPARAGRRADLQALLDAWVDYLGSGPGPARGANLRALLDTLVDCLGSGPARAERRADPAITAARRKGLMKSQYGVLADVAQRLARREVADVRRAARKMLPRSDEHGGQAFLDWCEEFYREWPGIVDGTFAPALDAYGALMAGNVADELLRAPEEPDTSEFQAAYRQRLGERWAGRSLAQLRHALEARADAPAPELPAVEDVLDRWDETRAHVVANEEHVRFGNAVAVALYGAWLIKLLRWHSFGDSCPYCRALNGRVVGIDEWFLQAGQEFTPEGALAALVPGHNVRHAPAHGGCDCAVFAG